MENECKASGFSRRQLLKSVAAGAAALSLPMSGDVSAQATRIDGQGKEQAPFSIAANKGKWIYLKCFQEWCPACHSVGFPNLQKLVAEFPNHENLVSAVVQTTFEGHWTNTFSALRKNQLRYSLDLPFGHDPGNIELPAEEAGRYPATMASYRTGGTPWVVLINPDGLVVFNDFHINMDSLITYFKKELA